MIIDILDIVVILMAFQCLLFAVFLIHRRDRKPANIHLATFFIVQLFIAIHIFIRHHHEFFLGPFPYLFFIGSPFYFLISPTLFLYTKSAAYTNSLYDKKQIIHLLPFVVVLIFYVVVFHIQPMETKRQLIEHGFLVQRPFQIISTTVLFIQIGVYCGASLVLLRRYRARLKEEYSSLAHINLSWLGFFLYGYLTAWATSIVFFLSSSLFSSAPAWLSVVNNLAFLLFFTMIFYKGLLQPHLFAGIEEKPKYLTSKLNRTDADEYAAALETYMVSAKPYREPSLVLNDLAAQLGIPPRFLSQVINEYHHKNFFDFINEYRINEARKMLCDPAGSTETILHILYEVGFNSKSSFNAAFKKTTGLTPTQYRKHGAPEHAASPVD